MLPETMPVLSGFGVTLRPFNEEDAALVQSVAQDPLIPLITTVPSTGTRDDALAYIARQNHRLPEGAGYSFAIADPGTDEAVGQIGLWLASIKVGRASTGYWIAPQFRRRRLASSALAVLAEWAFSLEEVKRLELYVEPWNEGSWRAAESCGFLREGLLRSWQLVGAERKDMFIYSRIAGSVVI